jgi:hypothetical protein
MRTHDSLTGCATADEDVTFGSAPEVLGDDEPDTEEEP